MEIQRHDITSFGLTARYSVSAKKTREIMSVTHPDLLKAIDAGKDKFAKITQSKGEKGDFCITDIITNSKIKDNFVIRFFVKGNKNFSDRIEINVAESLTPTRAFKKSEQQPSLHNLQENITTKFMNVYNEK